MSKKTPKQAEANIGLIGHVDHGKTTLAKALSGKWTDTYSEELKRGISIRLGYADVTFYKCEKCNEYSTKAKCGCGGTSKELRKISLVDAPGHETLLATMISGAAIVDGAILVIAANEKCPQPQTEEHLEALTISGTKNIVIAQNKIDLITKEEAKKNYEDIKHFLKKKGFEKIPIIPVAANQGINLSALIEAVEKNTPTPKRDLKKPALMYVARSFEVNPPGTEPEKLIGGVLGGSIVQGKLNVGDEIEICPGIDKKTIKTEVRSISISEGFIESAVPGGLLAIGTALDPALTKTDKMKGQVIGKPGTLPPLKTEIEIEIINIERKIEGNEDSKPIEMNEMLAVAIGTAVTTGKVISVSKSKAKLILSSPLCVEKDQRIVISRRVGMRWRLSGFGRCL
ncbi:MAG: translation initiation factor IF-2 subunit gamma [Candidatus Diapherotrites archaeon]|nr:translation initiation factor IF-2 subunit gamma [Candidatus Diapherotrites archaeon]